MGSSKIVDVSEKQANFASTDYFDFFDEEMEIYNAVADESQDLGHGRDKMRPENSSSRPPVSRDIAYLDYLDENCDDDISDNEMDLVLLVQPSNDKAPRIYLHRPSPGGPKQLTYEEHRLEKKRARIAAARSGKLSTFYVASHWYKHLMYSSFFYAGTATVPASPELGMVEKIELQTAPKQDELWVEIYEGGGLTLGEPEDISDDYSDDDSDDSETSHGISGGEDSQMLDISMDEMYSTGCTADSEFDQLLENIQKYSNSLGGRVHSPFSANSTTPEWKKWVYSMQSDNDSSPITTPSTTPGNLSPNYPSAIMDIDNDNSSHVVSTACGILKLLKRPRDDDAEDRSSSPEKSRKILKLTKEQGSESLSQSTTY
ncbi:hypothetical protein RUND412_003047 [Rhizina undulata]